MRKITLPIVFMVFIFAGIPNVSLGQVKPPLIIKVELDTDVYSLTEESKKEKLTTDVHSAGFFTVRCVIMNSSKKLQHFWMWSGSYYENWTTDNKVVKVRTWGVDKNFPMPVFLKPGESIAYKLSLKISSSKFSDIISFRMGLRPYIPLEDELKIYNGSKAVTQMLYPSSKDFLQGVYWSNALRIKIKR